MGPSPLLVFPVARTSGSETVRSIGGGGTGSTGALPAAPGRCVAEDDAELSALRKELSVKSELADLTLTQLHQAQQELHYYHQLCAYQAEILEKSMALLMKAVA